jgi:hypothetical protein
LIAATAALAASAVLVFADGAAATVTCPASASAVSASTAGPVQWAFSVLGAPTAGSQGVTWSWTRGKGVWSAGQATGTICSEEKGTFPRRELVLKVTGSSLLVPKTTRLGLLGVSVAVPVTVSATDDSTCPKGTRGTITLFASYYSVHRDSIVTHFAGACTDHNHTFTGSIVRVLITRNGAQVNST